MIVTGFQGSQPLRRRTTLGRGGSDTSAVAWRRPCGRIYARFTPTWTGYTRRTRASSPTPGKLDEVTYNEMLELATLGAQVLHNRSVEDGEEIQREPGSPVELSGIPAKW